MMIKPQNTNTEFALGGINHVALVCSDMARTVDFYSNVLGMPLIKSLDLPGGMGQHFFFDAGNGDCVAFFWFADAPDRVPGISSPEAIPGIGDILMFYRTSLFCRNLGLLLGCGVTLSAALRILVDVMAVTSSRAPWSAAADRVRHGGKLSQALSADNMLPPMALRMLRLGEETGQLPTLSTRIAEFYESKLQRGLDRVVGIVGPAAILLISVVVGGLIVSIMTALLSVTQLVG